VTTTGVSDRIDCRAPGQGQPCKQTTALLEAGAMRFGDRGEVPGIIRSLSMVGD